MFHNIDECSIEFGFQENIMNVVLARARGGAKSKEPGGAIVMLGTDGLKVLQDRKEQECYC
jgi:hypothetical protein